MNEESMACCIVSKMNQPTRQLSPELLLHVLIL